MLGSEVFEYDPARMLVFAVDLPVSGQVTRASRKDPYLGFRLDLDPARVAELAARVYPERRPQAADNRGLYVGHATDAIVDAVTRLLELMAHPEDADLLGPLVGRRDPDSTAAHADRQPCRPDRSSQRPECSAMAEAVSWIRAHFAQPVTVEEMAASVRMSASSFHQRFKAVTSMSPLQFQKVLRLHEARRLMLFQGMDASEACRRVGYLSPSQFSQGVRTLLRKRARRVTSRAFWPRDRPAQLGWDCGTVPLRRGAHWPWSQPFLVPVSCRCSRSASSSVVRVSTSSGLVLPLTSRNTGIITGACGGGDSAAAPGPANSGSAVVATDAAPPISNCRRVMSMRSRLFMARPPSGVVVRHCDDCTPHHGPILAYCFRTTPSIQCSARRFGQVAASCSP